jgi:hypothetical protein
MQFAVRPQRVHPAAQVTEGNWLSLDGHLLSFPMVTLARPPRDDIAAVRLRCSYARDGSLASADKPEPFNCDT